MRHQKYFLSLLAILFFSCASAQRMQAKFQVGYGIPLANNPQWLTLANNTYTIHSFSFGSGLRVEGGLIKQLTKNLSVQLDAAYLSGKKNSLQQVSGTSYSTANFYAKFFDVSPLLRFTMEESKIKPYVAVGPIFGFGKFYRDIENGTSGSTNVSTSIREYKGSFAFGTKSELGVQLQRGQFSYYVQLTVISMRYTPTSSELTSDIVNSTNQLSSLSVSQKQTVYVDSVPSTANPNSNQPSQALKTSYAFDSVSLNVGVMFRM